MYVSLLFYLIKKQKVVKIVTIGSFHQLTAAPWCGEIDGFDIPGPDVTGDGPGLDGPNPSTRRSRSTRNVPFKQL